MRQHPIWSEVYSDAYERQKSFGAQLRFTQDVMVGTSKKNSHDFASISVEKYRNDDGTVRFTLFVDGLRVKSGVLRGTQFLIDFPLD